MTVGRRSGRERSAILGYLEDGANLVTIPFNGWSDADPAWWFNLRGSRGLPLLGHSGFERCRAPRYRFRRAVCTRSRHELVGV